MNDKELRIGLTLSGGGVRAMAFHAGVLRKVSEDGHLEKIKHVSTVSGGTLLAGLVLSLNGNKWPTSSEYLEYVYPKIGSLMTERCIQSELTWGILLKPYNWRFIGRRAEYLSKLFEKTWGVKERLKNLPSCPLWIINATTAENGRRFRFKGASVGDYESGYSTAPEFPLASAMAVSAAFPFGIGALAFDATRHDWLKRASWGLDVPEDAIEPAFNTMHLYDGGLYDNLGLETVFDCGRQILKADNDLELNYLIVSDGGAPYARKSIPRWWAINRAKRIFDISSDQVRSLRVRSLMNYLFKDSTRGYFANIGVIPEIELKKFKKTDDGKWLDETSVTACATYPTNLKK